MDEKLVFEEGTIIAELGCGVGSFEDFNLGAGRVTGFEGGEEEEGLASSTTVDKVALYTTG